MQNVWARRRDRLGDTLSLILAVVFMGVGVINLVVPQFLESRLSGLLLSALGALITVSVWDRRIDREKYRQVDDALRRLEPSISVAMGALSADIVRLFPGRVDDKAESAIRELLSDPETRQISIAATALPSFFHTDHPYTETVHRSLERGVKFRVMLLDPRGQAADQRAARELANTTVQDIERSIQTIQDYMHRNLPIEARVYDFPPQLYMIQTDTDVFVETYHFGRILQRADNRPAPGCIGGLVPCYIARRNPGRDPRNGIWDILSDHFEYVWSGTNPDGSPLSLPVYSAINIDECDFTDGTILLQNCNRFVSINLGGWLLRATIAGDAGMYSETIDILRFSDNAILEPRQGFHIQVPFSSELAAGLAAELERDSSAAPGGTHIELVNRANAVAARFPNDGFILTP